MSYKASVKVMRSYDYCHFEVNLGTDQDLSAQDVDDMRRVAATLTDKAVADYKRMKADEPKRSQASWDLAEMRRKLKAIEEKPEGERTLNEVALMNEAQSQEFWARYKADEEFDYWNDSDVEREYHFTRLAKRQKVKV